MSENPWDALAPLFASEEGSVEPPLGVADTILLAWPPILEFLLSKMGSLRGKRILNFGCGAGHFCRRLSMLGAYPVGLDTSHAMIAAAKRIAAPDTILRLGGVESIQPADRFDAVACIMTLPFIADIKPVLARWREHLAADGLVVIAVFNPSFVRELLRSGHLFREFDSTERPRRGLLDLTGKNPVPVYIRYPEELTYSFEEHGLHLIFEARPPFTANFLDRYPQAFPTQSPEFLIMGFRNQTA
jgi:SAM-dependent methyltransferase